MVYESRIGFRKKIQILKIEILDTTLRTNGIIFRYVYKYYIHIQLRRKRCYTYNMATQRFACQKINCRQTIQNCVQFIMESEWRLCFLEGGGYSRDFIFFKILRKIQNICIWNGDFKSKAGILTFEQTLTAGYLKINAYSTLPK